MVLKAKLEYSEILDWVRRTTGVEVPSYRQKEVSAAALGSRARTDDLGATLPEAVVEAVRVGETYFFRHENQLDFITELALPALRAQRQPEHVFQVWSAGCATGEEPYTLSVLFHQAGLAERVRILGTDLSNTALNVARSARYGQWSMNRERPRRSECHFRKHGGRFELLPAYREPVSFQQHNLASGAFPPPEAGVGSFDLILCRNVLMYFSPEAVAAVARRFYDCLAPDAWLIAGPSDPPLFEHAPFQVAVTRYGVFYQRARDGSPVSHSGIFPKARAPGATPAPTPPPEPIRTAYELPSVPPAPPLPAAPPSAPALARARESVEREDERSAIAATQARVRASLNQGPPAVALYNAEQGAARHPMSAELHYLNALALLEVGRVDQAAMAFRRAAYLEPEQPEPHYMLAVLAERRGDPTTAAAAYRSVIELCGRSPGQRQLPLGGEGSYEELMRGASSRLVRLRGA